MSKRKVRMRYLFSMFMFALMLAVTNPTIAFARADRANAVADIMNDERFNGAIKSISWLTGRIDHWFTMIITATAFFIIASALLKNTCAGAYCANHKFWDKVAEAHEHNEAATLASMVQGIKGIPQMSVGSMKEAILCIVPNIKAFTDFDDADIEPRQYFMKAIPQMLMCVMIGVFIYNGYYRDTAALVGSMGSEICVRVFASVDPSTFLDKITQTTKTPPNIFAKDTTLQGKDMYALSKEIYKVCLSNSENLADYDDKEELMRNSELIAQRILAGSSMKRFYTVGRKFDYSISDLQVTIVNGYSSVSPNIRNSSGEVEDRWSAVAYAEFPTPAANQHPGKRLYISYSIIGTEKTRNTSVWSEIVAQAGQGQGVSSSSVSDVYRINVTNDSKLSNVITAKGDSIEMNLSNVKNLTVSDMVEHIASLHNGESIDQHLEEVLKSRKLENVKTITYKSHYVGGGNAQQGKLVGKVDRGGIIPITVSIDFTYTVDESTVEQTGSMDYTFNIMLTTNGDNYFPDLKEVEYMPGIQNDQESADT